MPIPEITSAEAFERYVGGRCLRVGKGEAWRDLKAWLVVVPSVANMVPLPAVSEPFLAWTTSDEAEFQERENDGPWITHRITKRTFFLTTGGAPYECRWKAVTPEPFIAMFVFLNLPILEHALEETFGTEAVNVRLRDVSGFEDEALSALMERLREELLRQKASRFLVQGIAQAIAIHLARNYSETLAEPRSASPSLPGYKLRQITDWMAEHIAEDFTLDQLAARAGLSKFHFNRLFKAATGVTPSHYQINLRLDAAKRLLRETKLSVIAVALEVGYTNPSHFGQLFRRKTGQSPTDYRRHR
jgi:AraC family transcriptional regulator